MTGSHVSLVPPPADRPRVPSSVGPVSAADRIKRGQSLRIKKLSRK